MGGALGDAFGYAVEFATIEDIRRRFGPDGITEPVLHDQVLLVSDDTQMTLFTLEGLLRFLRKGGGSADSCVESIRLAYMDWLYTQSERAVAKQLRADDWLATVQEVRVQRAPGNTCLSALRTGGRGTIRKPINNSKGCGGVMRVAPIGLVQKPFDPAMTFRVAADAAALTHGHPSGYLSAGVMAAMVRFLTEGADIADAVERSCELLGAYEGGEETLRALHKAMLLASKHPTSHVAAVEDLGGGWVGEEALAIGLYAVLSARTFTEAIRIAASHSGDSDSTAAIAGQLWGAMNGLEGMPHTWITALDVRKPLLHLARQFMPYT